MFCPALVEISATPTSTSIIIERISNIAYEIWKTGSDLHMAGLGPERQGSWVWELG
jgi:hypothetical protein